MLILSKFHDYYDTAIGYGVDKSIVYHRVKQGSLLPCGEPSNPLGVLDIMGAVVFCGAVYPFVALRYSNAIPVPTKEKDLVVCYNLSNYTKAMKGVCDDHTRPILGHPYSINKKKSIEDICRGQWRKFEVAITNHINPLELHREHHSPVQVIYTRPHRGYSLKRCETINNPCLKDYRFQKIKDPFTAFQDISMYISGVLGCKEDNIVVISDTDMRDAKGFDNKSFKHRYRR